MTYGTDRSDDQVEIAATIHCDLQQTKAFVGSWMTHVATLHLMFATSEWMFGHGFPNMRMAMLDIDLCPVAKSLEDTN